MTTYIPTITTRIPADVDASKHAEIKAKLDAARKTLAGRDSHSRQAAIEMAAWAITRSGAGACAYPDARISR